MRARISYPGFISNKRTSTMRTRNSSNVRLRFRSADSPLAGTIRYGIGTCTHGAFLVARGDDGICAILMSDKADFLHTELVEVFPSNRLEESSALRLDLVAVASFLDDSQSDAQLELTVGGTTFQQRVWKPLCKIPSGKTRSYSEFARNIGEERAARAVAACAANILAIAIPCHRVVKATEAFPAIVGVWIANVNC